MPPKSTQKPIFKGLVIAMACTLGGQWTDVNIARWVGQRRGVFTAQMDDSVTHLLCSPDEFKNKGPRVKQALKLGIKACHIVTIDWLEDSITNNRKLQEKPYDLTAALREERAKQRLSEREAKGLEQAEKFVNQNLYHVYADQTHFRYEVTLTRDDAEQGIQGQRYTLFLFESNAKPHLYWFAAKFFKKRHDSQPKFHRPGETPHLFSTEFFRFTSFFQKKAGIPWEERLIRSGTSSREFSYTPPTRGKPVGFVPEYFLPPEPEEAQTVGEGDAKQAKTASEATDIKEQRCSLQQGGSTGVMDFPEANLGKRTLFYTASQDLTTSATPTLQALEGEDKAMMEVGANSDQHLLEYTPAAEQEQVMTPMVNDADKLDP